MCAAMSTSSGYNQQEYPLQEEPVHYHEEPQWILDIDRYDTGQIETAAVPGGGNEGNSPDGPTPADSTSTYITNFEQILRQRLEGEIHTMTSYLHSAISQHVVNLRQSLQHDMLLQLEEEQVTTATTSEQYENEQQQQQQQQHEVLMENKLNESIIRMQLASAVITNTLLK